MLKYTCVLLTASLLFACGSDAKRTNNETALKAEYTIYITGDHETTLVGEHVSSAWSPSDGLIYLGTEEVKLDEPIGTLTMTLGPQISQELNEYAVISATLSKTDRAVGTADQLNARLFTLVGGSITNVEIGANYIKGYLDLKMERVLVYSWNQPESVDVIGPFTAISN